jgi:hypothetical protein
MEKYALEVGSDALKFFSLNIQKKNLQMILVHNIVFLSLKLLN